MHTFDSGRVRGQVLVLEGVHLLDLAVYRVDEVDVVLDVEHRQRVLHR